MQLEVLNSQGLATGKTVELPADVFGLEPNDHVIYLDVKQYLANQRQGTHKSKERSEMSGSTRKLKKQKGTGGARAGDINSPTMVGGGRAFGPKPRDYGFKLNKKVKVLARKSALSYKAMNNNIIVVEDFSIEAKTKAYLAVLKSLKLDAKKSILVTTDYVDNLTLASRNIPNATVMTVADLCTYDIMNANKLILTTNSVSQFNEYLNK